MDVIPWTARQVSSLSKALVIPNIRRMHLSIERPCDIETNINEWLNIFLCHDTFSTLEDFTFDFLDYDCNCHKNLTYEIPGN